MESFGESLKTLRKSRNLTQAELAKEMHLGQTTIANYEKGLRFPNIKILKNFADFFGISLDLLLNRERLPLNKNLTLHPLEYEEIRDKYIEQLIKGNFSSAYEWILKGVYHNFSLDLIYSKILQPSLIKVGALWEENTLNVAQEHYISEATEQIISLLYGHYPIVQNKNKRVASLCAPGEIHSIGLKMIHNLLEQDGWTAYFLGNNVPTPSLLSFVKEQSIDLLIISTTMDYHLNSLENLISTLKNTENKKDMKIMVGGRPFNQNPELWKKIHADGFSKDCMEAVDRANKLVK